jgi:CRISPR system Cascade subunit CasC
MARFVQLHVLTNYPPANLNRDDTGRPKTALMGDALRLRVSSQSEKRAWRSSDVFKLALGSGSTGQQAESIIKWENSPHANLGTRTKEAGVRIYEALINGDIKEKDAREWAKAIASQFGALEKEDKEKPLQELKIKQLCHVSPEEKIAIDMLVKICLERKSAATDKELELLRHPHSAVDIAMFGRMLADSSSYNVEAAVQVAHAITVHKTTVEDDYFSAVDDLNRDDKRAAHIGERGYGAGLFYQYVCIDRELLKENLGDDQALTNKSLAALVHAITKVSPTGMQNSHASRAHASFVLAEKGDQQPRSLVQAFLKPIKPREDEDMHELAVNALDKRCTNFDKVYGACADARYRINVEQGEGSLAELVTFVQE